MEIAIATVLCATTACAVWMFFDYIGARKAIGRVYDLERRIQRLEGNERAMHHRVQWLVDEKYGISMWERMRMDREWEAKERGCGDHNPG